jgi:hypothetical protein
MTTPIVTELPRPLQAVTRDPFIDATPQPPTLGGQSPSLTPDGLSRAVFERSLFPNPHS